MEYFSKILHIDLDENAQSIIQRFFSLEDHDIIFAIPSESQIFRNPIELKLLKQAIDKSGKNIVLVSQDELGLELARDIGFKVEEEFLELLSPGDEETHKYSAETHKHPKITDIIYKDGRTKAPLTRKIIMEETQIPPEIEEYEKKASEFAVFQPQKEKLEEKLAEKEKVAKRNIFSIINIIIIFIALSVIVAAISMVIILPKATISISPKKETVILDLPIKADISISEINVGQNKIPGQIVKIEKEKTLEFEASGKTSEEKKAGGKITIYNAYAPPQDQSLVKTTRFETSDGKIFRITQNIIVPSAKMENGGIVPGQIEADVIADGSGPEYNIGPGEFTVPGFKGTSKFNAFYGKSSLAMQGGSKGESSLITSDDIENSKKTIENELFEEAKTELKEKLPKDLESVDDAITVKIIEENISAKAGTAAKNFSITLKVSAMAFLFQDKDVKLLIAKNIETKIMRDKIIYKDMRKKYDKINADFTGGAMSFNAQIEQDISASFDEKKLKEAFAGKNETQIREYIMGQDLIESANVSFWPKFVKIAPNNPERINVIIEQ